MWKIWSERTEQKKTKTESTMSIDVTALTESPIFDRSERNCGMLDASLKMRICHDVVVGARAQSEIRRRVCQAQMWTRRKAGGLAAHHSKGFECAEARVDFEHKKGLLQDEDDVGEGVKGVEHRGEVPAHAPRT